MKDEANQLLAHYIRTWNLIPDGNSFHTRSSLLQPVLFNNIPAFIKIPIVDEEKWGSKLMVWWDGEGAVRILKYDENALLMERALSDKPSLKDMVGNGQDDEATLLICNVAEKLHVYKKLAPPELTYLQDWFDELWLAASQYGGILKACAIVANELFQSPEEIVVLHGDLHHENVLHTSAGWAAIDPKGLIGERGFDYANILCNPDEQTALTKGRLSKQAAVIAKAVELDHARFLKWIIAWAGLSASWIMNDGEDAKFKLTIAELAMNELTNGSYMK
jgi:streptomycin 6-kinase